MKKETRKKLGAHLFDLLEKDRQEKGITEWLIRKGEVDYPFAMGTLRGLPKGEYSLTLLEKIIWYLDIDIQVVVRDEKREEKIIEK